MRHEDITRVKPASIHVTFVPVLIVPMADIHHSQDLVHQMLDSV